MDAQLLAVETRDGLVLRGEAQGDPRAPLVLLLHGGGQTRNAWSGELPLLAAEGYRAVSFDLRGHGESDWAADGDYRIQAHASDLRSILALFPRPLVLVGASLGGLAAFYTIGTSGETLADGLVLVDIAPRVGQAGSDRIQSFMRAHTEGFASIDEAAAAISAYNPERSKPVRPASLHRNLRLRENGRLYWHWDPKIIERTTDFDPVAIVDIAMSASVGVTLPTLLVRGGSSDIVGPESVAALKALVPHVEVFDIPRAGHMVAGDDNSTFHAGIRQFLARSLSTGKVASTEASSRDR